ncbi:MAG: helix-turn-helix transcriptional regulator [Janthinobacterium lividum]
MNEATDIDALARRIAAKITPHALWDLAAIALYLHRSENYTRQHLTTLPGFPPAIRLPVAKSKGLGKGKAEGRPLWRSRDIIAWAESHVDA